MILDLLHFDMGTEIGGRIREFERKLKSYKYGNKVHLWNKLLCAYEVLSIERRLSGRKREAEELWYHMLKARMKRVYWLVFSFRKIRYIPMLIESIARLYIYWCSRSILTNGRLILAPIFLCSIVYWLSSTLFQIACNNPLPINFSGFIKSSGI